MYSTYDGLFFETLWWSFFPIRNKKRERECRAGSVDQKCPVEMTQHGSSLMPDTALPYSVLSSGSALLRMLGLSTAQAARLGPSIVRTGLPSIFIFFTSLQTCLLVLM